MGYPVLDLPLLPDVGDGSEAGAEGPDSPD